MNRWTLKRPALLQAVRRVVMATAVAGLLVSAGCGGSLRLLAQRAEVMTPGAVRVVLKATNEDIIEFDVHNYTGSPMVIYRDAVYLSTSRGLRNRVPGGVSNVYTIPPGGVQQVNVRYKLDDLSRGDQLAVVFQNAVVIDGQPVPVEPIPFVLQ